MCWRVVVALAALWLAGRAAVAEPAREPVHDAAARGEAVALLPLDAERSLEIYGQPVASELARALSAGNVTVVVVGPRMAVPERARLIIDGTITVGRTGAVTIALRLRRTLDGIVLDTLSATASGLAKIDAAAAELSARIVPLVRDHLAELALAVARPGDVERAVGDAHPPRDRPLLVAVGDAGRRPSPVLQAALDAAVADWAAAHHRKPHKLEPARLDPKLAAATVAASDAELAVGFWIVDYAAVPGDGIAMGRARVRVAISDAHAVLFDRVVATDTVLGDRGQALPDLAARVAREVLEILRPHMRLRVPSW